MRAYGRDCRKRKGRGLRERERIGIRWLTEDVGCANIGLSGEVGRGPSAVMRGVVRMACRLVEVQECWLPVQTAGGFPGESRKVNVFK